MSEPVVPKVGQLLYRGCACDDFARVLRVGQDDNDNEVVDVELLDANDLNDLYYVDAQSFSRPEDEIDLALTRIELPKGTRVVIRDVWWKPAEGGNGAINLRMTTGGCYRCTELFYPHDEGVDPFANAKEWGK